MERRLFFYVLWSAGFFPASPRRFHSERTRLAATSRPGSARRRQAGQLQRLFLTLLLVFNVSCLQYNPCARLA
jgi:hypothetical protein